MDNYIGVKLIQAEPKTHGEYSKIKYGENNKINATEFSIQNKDSEGYMVKYDNDYISWSPKDVFENAYFRLSETEKKNSIAQNDIDRFIKDINSIQLGEKTTLTTVTLINGFEITESSSCVDKENFDMELGEKICVERIKGKVWELLGFLLQCGVGGLNE